MPQVQVLSLGPDKAVLSLERAAFLQFIWRFQNPENCIKIQAETKRMPLQVQRSIRFCNSNYLTENYNRSTQQITKRRSHGFFRRFPLFYWRIRGSSCSWISPSTAKQTGSAPRRKRRCSLPARNSRPWCGHRRNRQMPTALPCRSMSA